MMPNNIRRDDNKPPIRPPILYYPDKNIEKNYFFFDEITRENTIFNANMKSFSNNKDRNNKDRNKDRNKDKNKDRNKNTTI